MEEPKDSESSPKQGGLFRQFQLWGVSHFSKTLEGRMQCSLSVGAQCFLLLSPSLWEACLCHSKWPVIFLGDGGCFPTPSLLLFIRGCRGLSEQWHCRLFMYLFAGNYHPSPFTELQCTKKNCIYLRCAMFWCMHTLWNDYHNQDNERISHLTWLPFSCVVRTLNICSLSRFQVYSIVLTIGTMLYIVFPEFIHPASLKLCSFSPNTI